MPLYSVGGNVPIGNGTGGSVLLNDSGYLALRNLSGGNGFAFTDSAGNPSTAGWATLVATGFKLISGSTLAWTSSSTSAIAANDLVLARDAANVLAQRNSTNAQTSRIYNTFTDSSNGEWAEVTWSSNVAYLRAQKNGTGTQRNMVPVTGTTTVASLPAAATAGAGARLMVTDSNTTTFMATVASGGANIVPVVSDGTNWKVG